KILIENLTSPGDLVCDPMMGCGTSIEVASKCGRKAIGGDINPIATLIAGVAVGGVNLGSNEIYQHWKAKLQEDFRVSVPQKQDLPRRRDFHNWHIWFRPEVVKELYFLRGEISKFEDLSVRNFLYLSLSGICRSVSNADPRDLYPQRDAKLPVRERMDVLAKFFAKVDSNEKLLAGSRPNISKVDVARFDARKIPLKNQTCQLVLFSPPYLDALDYTRVHQLSHFILGMGRGDLRKHRQEYLGSPLYKNLPLAASVSDRKFFEFGFKCGVSSKKRETLKRYLRELSQILSEARRILRPGGYLALIVGSPSSNKNIIPLSEYVTELSKEGGFKLVFEHERKYYLSNLSPERNSHARPLKSEMILVFQSA
ncbi:MAG: hypothetical protein KDD53_11970, partial [Bdellovibrionales bacterium]|nr:hypothetical protein [Bdellovibrionales bacterium]